MRQSQMRRPAAAGLFDGLKRGGQAPGRSGVSGGLASGIRTLITKVWPYLESDLIIGFLVWLAFSFGTGVYAKQLEIWLKFHSSGEAAKIRGLGLEGATAQENEGRRRPVL